MPRTSTLRSGATRLLVLLLVSLGAATPASRSAEPGDKGVAAPSELAAHTVLLDAAPAGNAVVAVGERGVILRSEDQARSWIETASHAEATLTGVSFSNATNGWAVGHDGLILATADGGKTWSKQWQSDSLQDSFLDVLALDPKHIIAVGAFSLYVSTSDGGATWARRKITDEDYHFNRIIAGSDRDALVADSSKRNEDVASAPILFIAGEHGTLLRSADGGGSWQPLHVPYEGSLYGVLPLRGRTLLCYGLRGRVYFSDDNGDRWTAVSTNESWLISTGARLADGSVILAGNGRTLLVSRDPRRTFAARDVGAPAAIAELLPLPDGNVLAVGEAGAERIDQVRILPPPPASLEPGVPPRNDTK